jgi:hypothetical protein
MQKPNLVTGNALINKWKIKLSLIHWDVRLWIDETLPLEVRGRVYWEGQLKDATIVLNKRYDWSKYPVEQTVIHELLHLSLAETGDPSPEYIEEHIAVLSDLLFQAYGDRSV